MIRLRKLLVSLVCFATFGTTTVGTTWADDTATIRVSSDHSGFILGTSNKAFIPWGFNYDHDSSGRLLEDYWDKEWPKVEGDFHQMRLLGANVVRIHLQLGRFLKSADKPNEANFAQLAKLLSLAEKENLYLDLTGLACYHKQDVPTWYDRLSEEDRWNVQARFWELVAKQCAPSPSIFCYDLMNEPVVPGGARKSGDWLGPPFGGSCFVQFISLDAKDRPRPAVARQWCRKLARAIRKVDARHLVTVGLVPWSLDKPGLSSGFVPKEVAGEIDFLCVHVYPAAHKGDEAIQTLNGFAVGKPVVVEEMFPLACSVQELEQFIDRSKPAASGWIGFYWGKTPEEYRQGKTLSDAITLSWLELFQRKRPTAIRMPFTLGADISWAQEQEDHGTKFSDHGKQKDILEIFKDRGFRAVRLRLFNDPKAAHGYSRDGYCDLEHTLQMVKRIKLAGMQLMLDFHYSDNWADPGHQIKPAAWTDLHGVELEKAVHDFTRDTMLALKKQNTSPDIVQIGNEISNGFLWPDGQVWKSGRWDVFAGLIKAGVAGVKEVDPKVKIMLHLAWGGQNAQSRSFLDHAVAQGIQFDILGQSYYRRWHGTLDELKANLTDLAGRYPQEIMVVEYSVPDVQQVNDIVHALPGGKGVGTFIWEPTKWNGPALFDGQGRTKPEIEAYPKMAKEFGDAGQ